MKLTRILLLFLLILNIRVSAQEFAKDDVAILYKHEWSGGLVVHTTGLGFDLRRGFHKTGDSKILYTLEGVSMKAKKERKSVHPVYDNPKSYVFGKLNTLHVIRLGVGQQKVITGKNKKGAIEIKRVLLGGLNLGLMKPYYLEISENPLDPIRTERFDANLHRVDNIYGRAPFKVGMNEMNIYPGAFLKLGCNFEYGFAHDDIKSLEVGVVFDAYHKKLPVMANSLNNQFNLNLYISFLYGRKWY